MVERNGDLLGDGVNIAARLEGIAPVGGICISRTVYEQVANKLSVQFADIGEQQVKNIPTPVHAYKFEMRPDDRSLSRRLRPRSRSRENPHHGSAGRSRGAGCRVIAIAALAYLLLRRTTQRAAAERVYPAAPAFSDASRVSQPAPQCRPHAPPQPISRQAEALVPETIPFIAEVASATIRNEYMPAADHKALAISSGPIGFTSGQADDETAKVRRADVRQKRADALPQQRKCGFMRWQTRPSCWWPSADAAGTVGVCIYPIWPRPGRWSLTTCRCCGPRPARRRSR